MSDYDANIGGTRRSAGTAARRLIADRSVGAKILTAVGVVALAAAGIGLVAIAKLGVVDAKAEAVYTDGIQPTLRVERVYQAELSVKADIALHANAPNAATMTEYEQIVADDEAKLDSVLAEYVSGSGNEDRNQIVEQFTQAWSEFRTIYTDTLFPLSRKNDQVGWTAAYESRAKSVIAKAENALDGLLRLATSRAEIDAAASATVANSARRTVIILLVVGLVVAVTAALAVARLIVVPLRQVVGVLDAVADGDLTRRVELDGKDELGVMAGALNRATETMRGALRTIDQSAGSLAAASEQMSGVGVQIAASAEESSAQAGVAASAAEQVSQNVHTVATSSEEMGASIREIAQNANEAAKVAATAVAVAGSTNATVSKLGDSSVEIGNVVKVITSIAEQTNLLALNATIEAARAGEAGKGFAVVANEVKDLAQETARATDDISRRVSAIQSDTGGAVEAIAEIGRIIGQINDYQLTIASAVEEQTATTNEINRVVGEAAVGSAEIASNISGVAAAAQVTTQGVAESQRAVGGLTRISAELQSLVTRFRV